MSMKDTWPAAAETIARGGTINAAATAANVTRQTVARWMADEPTFADTVAETRHRMVDAATGTLTAATVAWAETLANLATDPSVAPQFRIAACRAGLELAARYRNDTTIEERIRSLELAAGLRNGASL
jgi:hypothetical protein